MLSVSYSFVNRLSAKVPKQRIKQMNKKVPKPSASENKNTGLIMVIIRQIIPALVFCLFVMVINFKGKKLKIKKVIFFAALIFAKGRL